MADIRTNQTNNVTLYDESGNQVAIALGGTPTAVIPVQGAQPAATSQTGITGTGAQTAVSIVGYNVATVTLRTFTGTTPSITWKLQASDDNTNWIDLQGTNNATGVVGTSFTQGAALTAGTAGPSVDYTVGAYTQIRINVTAISGTSATAAFGIGVQSMPYEATPAAIINGYDGTNYQRVKTDTSGYMVELPSASSAAAGASQSFQSALTNTKVAVNASGGNLYGYHIYNSGSAVAFVQFFNVASASVTLGTTTPNYVVAVPAGGWADTALNVPLSFATALTVAATSTATGSTAPGSTLMANFWYK